MESIKIKLENCYEIKNLDETLSFKVSNGIHNRAVAIYAPNGLMKTSFTRVFEDLAKAKTPKEERYNRTSSCTVEVDGNIIPKEIIYVLRSDIDIVQETTAFTNVLVDPAKQSEIANATLEYQVVFDSKAQELVTSKQSYQRGR